MKSSYFEMTPGMPQPLAEIEDRSLLRRAIPAWLLSFIVHATALIVGVLCWQVAPRGIEEPERGVGIVLTQASASGAVEYFDDAGEGGNPAAGSAPPQGSETSEDSEATADVRSLSDIALPGSEQTPLTSGPQLPKGLTDLGAAGELGLPGREAGLPGVGGFTQGGTTGSGGIQGQGQATLNVFGVQGTGSRFIYVFDRSLSMSGFQGRPLAAAKRELIASLASLGSVHQFQIIFYNEEPQVFNTSPGQPPQLVFASEENKQRAEKYVASMSASGGTQHMEALLKALALNPDVVFFLTDADDPKLTDADLTRIRGRNRNGAVIHCIEYGSGVSQSSNNFLTRLAAQNRGQHAYVDVSRLPRKK